MNEQIDSGRKVIERLMQNGLPIQAAAWVKESSRWDGYLWLVTPLVKEDGDTMPAYRRLLAVLRSGPWPADVDPFRIKVVGASEPVGQAILAAVQSGRRPWDHLGDLSLGGRSIDGAYIDPPLVAAE